MLVGILVFIGGLLPVIVWARWRWKKLKPELFSQAELTGQDSSEQSSRCALELSHETVARLLSRAESILECEEIPNAQAAADAIHRIALAAPQTTDAIRTIIQGSMEKAELRSLLLNDNGMFIYIVVAPNRHDHAHLIGRYPAFSTGWRRHAEILRSSLKSGGMFGGLAALLFFLSPDGKDCIARIALAGPDLMLIPGALAQTGDLAVPGVEILDASFEFSFAAGA